ncbi:hypothetical protein ACWGIV_24560 [Streptomyces sp. NPDC054844]
MTFPVVTRSGGPGTREQGGRCTETVQAAAPADPDLSEVTAHGVTALPSFGAI